MIKSALESLNIRGIMAVLALEILVGVVEGVVEGKRRLQIYDEVSDTPVESIHSINANILRSLIDPALPEAYH